MNFRAVLIVTLLGVAGCGKAEEVRRYRAPKEPAWRMLAAIVPGSGATWFFKATGPTDLVGPRQDEIVAFLRTLKSAEGELRWTLPAGWSEEKGAGDRQSSLTIGTRDPKLEMTVVKLAGDGGGMLANVNRWRDQMGLEKIKAEALDGAIRKIEAEGLQISLVDLSGPKRPVMRAPPHAGGQARTAPPPGQPSLDDVRGMFRYELPAGWEDVPQPGQGRIFEFRAGEALVTFSILGGEGGGLAANLNRWRQQAGLEPVPDDQAAAWTRQVRFLGRDGWSTEAIGKDRAVVVTFGLNPEFSMFLKLDGTPDAVRAQRAAFDAFASSFRMGAKRE